MGSPEYKYERLSDENIHHLKYLYLKCFSEKTTINFLKQKYNTLSFGVHYLGFIAYSAQGEPAAYYGVFPLLGILRGKKILIAQSGDTMTHPDHRGKGLFILLAKMTYSLAKKEGIEFVFGFPNKNSFPGFQKNLNWIFKENLNIFEIKIWTIPFARVAGRWKFLKPIYNIWLSFIFIFFHKAKKEFDNSCGTSGKGCVLRDESFYKYKKYYRNIILELAGKKVWLKIDGKLKIGDLEIAARENIKKIIWKIKKLAFFAGCTEIVFQFSPDAPWVGILEQLTNKNKGLPIGYLALNGEIDPSLFVFSQGDSDTF